MNDTSNVGVNSVPETSTTPAPQTVTQPVTPVVTPVVSATPVVTPVASATPVVTPSPVTTSEPVLTNPIAQTAVSANTVPASVTPVVTPIAPTPQAVVTTTPVTPTVEPVVTPVAPAVQPTTQTVTQAATQTPVTVQPTVSSVAATSVVTPVAPAVMTQEVAVKAPEAPIENSKVEVQLADNIKIDSEKKKEKKKKEKKEKKASDYEDEEEITVKANRYPIALAVVFVSILLLMFVYYYLVMTPYNVFDSALSSMVDAIKDVADNFGNEDSDRNTFDLQFDLKTDNEQVKNNSEQTPVDYVNGDHIQGIVNFDTKSKGFSLNLLGDKLVKNLPDGVEPIDKSKNRARMLDLKFYSFKDNMYIGPIYYINYNDPNAANMTPIDIDKIIQVSFGTESFGRDINIESFTIDSLSYAADLIDLIIEKGKTTVFDSDLERGIVFKKVGDSTAIALKANCDTDSKMIDRVFHGTFDEEFINRKEVIDLTRKVFGFSEEEARELLEEIHNRPQDIQHLDINLYMNLANTELISFDMTFDNKFYIELDYLKGFYSLTIRVMTDGKEENDKFNLKADYNRDNGDIDGLGIINNENTFLAVKFDYDRKVTTTGEKIGNILDFKFYNNDTYKQKEENQKPFCILNCTLDIYESNDDPSGKTNFDLESEVKDAYILPVSQYKTNSGIIIKSTLTDAPKISVQEGLQVINFEKGFVSHVMYVVDHLLYNKEGAIARREAKNEAEEDLTENNEEINTSDEKTKSIESSEENITQEVNTEETVQEES